MNPIGNSLEQDHETDVLIIGGGITGVLIAYELSKNNIKYTLVEKDIIGSKTTSETTAFITAYHENLYQNLSGLKAKTYLDINIKALNDYKELSEIYDIDYEEISSCLFSKDFELINNEYMVLKNLHQDVKIINDIPYNNECIGIKYENQAIINPVKLVNALKKDLNIYENSEVIKLYKNEAIMKNGVKVKFKKVIIATNYPINNKLNLLFMKLTQRRSYVCVINKNKIPMVYSSVDDNGLYFRSYKNYLIIGGFDRDTGKNCLCDFEKKVCELFKISRNEIMYSWTGQDSITIDGIPYIGISDIFHRNHIIVTGFNFWGFTWAMASKDIVLDIIKNNKIFKLTKVNRMCINKNLIMNIINSFKNIIRIGNPRCAHLGCKLIYNKKEKIWECPCHGSIYNDKLKVLRGPANKNIKNNY